MMIKLIIWVRMFSAHALLTCTLVEFAGLFNVPFAKLGPLSNRWPDSIDVISRQDGV